MGLAAPWNKGSSWTRGGTCVSCIGRQILYHWATREAQLPGYSWWRTQGQCDSVGRGGHMIFLGGPSVRPGVSSGIWATLFFSISGRLTFFSSVFYTSELCWMSGAQHNVSASHTHDLNGTDFLLTQNSSEEEIKLFHWLGIYSSQRAINEQNE